MGCTFIAVLLVVGFIFFACSAPAWCGRGHGRESDCTIGLVESIPENLTYPDGSIRFPTTSSTWTSLINQARHHIHIASFYWSLLGSSVVNESVPSSKDGEYIFSLLMEAGAVRNISVKIVNNLAKPNSMDELDLLAEKSGAQVQYLNMSRFNLAGILHTKLFLVDGRLAYVGSANMDFRSLTQVKELGVMLDKCPSYVADLERLFEVYWLLSSPDAKLPPVWNESYWAMSNATNPFHYTAVDASETGTSLFFASSPPLFSTPQRSEDIDAIVGAINSASEFIYLAVMDYAPLIVNYHGGHSTYWSNIDTALRAAAVTRGVEVRFLVSNWTHTSRDQWAFMGSLNILSSIRHVRFYVKMFTVPTITEEQRSLPYCRVNHNKYLVTDKTAYISTSNFEGSYFTNTCGISTSITPREDDSRFSRPSSKINDDLRTQTEHLFLRDWNSEYATYIFNLTTFDLTT